VFRKTMQGVLLISIYSVGTMAYEVWLLGSDLEFPQGVHTLLGVSLSMLMVFRNNSSYDRWWEGRKLWGTLVNESRSLASAIWHIPTLPEEERHQSLQLISRFAFQLRDHLRGPWPAPDNLPQRTTMKLYASLNDWQQRGLLETQQYLVIERHLSVLFDVLGACERIRGTPLPLSHRAVVPQSMLTYLLALPWGLPNSHLSVLIVAVVSYFLVSLEMIAEELEEPFGQDPDDLPLTRTCLNIEKSIQRFFEPPPVLIPEIVREKSFP